MLPLVSSTVNNAVTAPHTVAYSRNGSAREKREERAGIMGDATF
jgi:hypothetical protein